MIPPRVPAAWRARREMLWLQYSKYGPLVSLKAIKLADLAQGGR